MNQITTKLLLLALAPFGLFLSSCETDDLDDDDSLENRLERRNDTYEDLQDNRRRRIDARQERTDDWFDRVMGD